MARSRKTKRKSRRKAAPKRPKIRRKNAAPHGAKRTPPARHKKPLVRRRKTARKAPARRKKASRKATMARRRPRRASRKATVRARRLDAIAGLSHLDQRGQARMVDVTAKGATERQAIAEGRVIMSVRTLDQVLDGNALKGDVLGAARLAGIMAAKRTHGLIPLCHPLPITKVSIDIDPEHSFPGFLVRATVKVTAQTGVEMEALTAVSIACLTIYDMVKAIEKGMRIEGVRLLEKTGGKSGTWTAGS
jgi:cyclic pyranopterin phosphate synthase